MHPLPPTKNEPPFTPEHQLERSCTPSTIKTSKVADKAFKTIQNSVYKGALFTAKCIAIPIELTLMIAVAALAALSVVASLPLRLVVDSKTSLTPFQKLISTIDLLWEIVKITYHFGLFPKNEQLQLADDKPDSPKFALITPTTQSTTPPILYAPGYLDSPDTLRDTCRKLAEDNKAPVYIVKYRSLFQSIDEHTKDVARVEQRIVEDTGRKDIILIGHSMGGITTGRFIQQMEPGKADVKLWITLGSPLTGTPLARFGYGKCSQDMNPQSKLIEQLNKEGPLNDVPSLHIYSLSDGVVPPDSAAGPKGAIHSSYQCKHPYSHLGMRSKAEVEAQIQNAIQAIF